MLDIQTNGEIALELAEMPREVSIPLAVHSERKLISGATRAFNHVFQLQPLPSPGSVYVSYRAQNKWYTLQDNGTGGFDGVGSGTVVYTTGSVNVTLAELPDADTQIIVQWGETSAFTDRAGQASWNPPEYEIELPDDDVAPGTLTVAWTSANAAMTASDDGNGDLTGDATGYVDYPAGVVFLRTNALLDAGVQFQFDYQAGLRVSELMTGLSADGSGFVTLNTQKPIAPGTLECFWITQTTIKESEGDKESTARSEKTICRKRVN